MSLCININVWRRPHVFRNVLASIRAQVDAPKIEILCAVSPDDPDLLTNERSCYEFGAIPVSTPNLPLSNKANALTLESRKYEFDYLMKLGSDDVLSPNFVSSTLEHADGGYGWGWADCYFWGPIEKRLYYWPGYGKRRQESIGAGRVVRRDVLEMLNWQTHEFGLSRNLDKSFTDRLASVGVSLSFGHLPANVYIVDCKDEVSITPMEAFEKGSLVEVSVPECLKEYL